MRLAKIPRYVYPNSNVRAPEAILISEQWADWSRTIGRPPTPAINPEDDVSLTLELATGSDSRYLVQRWGNGSVCEITGEPREVEIQVRLAAPRTTLLNLLFLHAHILITAVWCSFIAMPRRPRMSSHSCGKSKSARICW